MKRLRWSLVCIKTNGLNFKQDSITDIAIVTLEHWQVIECWQSLVKPNQPIPHQIVQLTGISNTMAGDARTFNELAFEIYNRLSGNLFISHNARLDYAYIKNAFLRRGIKFSEKVVCAVKLSRALYPQFRQHNLDSLIKRFNFEVTKRHRSMVDVDSMQQFLLQCRKDFGDEAVSREIVNLTKKSSQPPNLLTNLDSVPNTSGVYLFYGQNKSMPIYIGKSINLKKRILSHFSADYTSAKELKISQHVNHIEWQETAGELGALLLESKLIKEKKPLYNRRLRHAKKIAIFKIKMINGYRQVSVVYLDDKPFQSPDELFGSFKSKRAAEEILSELIKIYRLCPKLCGLDKSAKQCFDYQLKRCDGACLQMESAELYNLKVDLALKQYKSIDWPYQGAIAIREKSGENGQIQIHVINQWRHLATVSSESELKGSLPIKTPLITTCDDKKIIQSYLRKNKGQMDIVTL